MEHWKQQETRCKGKRERDGKRCKVRVHAGEYLCEHHRQDLASFARDPNFCIELMQKRFPKRHHPACDRKGQNDCSCPDYSRGAQAVMALRKAVTTSQSLSPLYRKKKRLEMRLKVKKIRRYYRRITEAELWLPPYPGFRQFRFFLWDDKQETVVVRVIKDNIRHKKTLLKWLRKLAPLHVYYTTSAWMNPQGIGPDPYGKRGRAKLKKKRWVLKEYHNNMMWQELYFDVDYDNGDYNEGAKMLEKTINAMEIEAIPRHYGYRTPYRVIEKWSDDYGDFVVHPQPKCVWAGGIRNTLKPPYTIAEEYKTGTGMIVFSGGKGFHLIYPGYRTKTNIKDYNDINTKLTSNDRQRISRTIRKDIVELMKGQDPELLLDWEVTIDPRRIIRLPGTVHGKTLRVCKVIHDLEGFIRNDDGDIVGYEPDDPIG